MNIATRELSKARRTSTPHIELRLARTEDAPKIAPFLHAFFTRSAWSRVLTFNEPKALAYLQRVIGSGYAPYAVAFDGDELVGVCSYHTFDVFTDPIAVMDETYVVPRLKRTDLGRRLVALAIEMARADGCKVMNFPIASGMPEQNGLMNMVGHHFGAVPIGMIFMKVL